MKNAQLSLPIGTLHQWGQRWFEGRDSYRAAQEPIRASDFTVEPIDKAVSKRFIETHHYSGTFIYEIASFGLFHKPSPLQPARLVGAAAFATPSNPNSIKRWVGLDDFRLGAELGRFVLLDEVAGNGETFFLARALQGLKKIRPEIKTILSYSDPMPRQDLVAGRTRFIGHYGSIYQASNSIYAGRSGTKTLLLAPNGEALPNRLLAKFRGHEQGHVYAQERIQQLSGLTRLAGESEQSFLARAMPVFRKVRHPGNHLYLFPLAADRREKNAILNLPAIRAHRDRQLPYPKTLDLAA